jgi:hypothetical protein
MSMRFESDERVRGRGVAGAGALVRGLGLVAVSAFMFFENLGEVRWRP